MGTKHHPTQGGCMSKAKELLERIRARSEERQAALKENVAAREATRQGERRILQGQARDALALGVADADKQKAAEVSEQLVTLSGLQERVRGLKQDLNAAKGNDILVTQVREDIAELEPAIAEVLASLASLGIGNQQEVSVLADLDKVVQDAENDGRTPTQGVRDVFVRRFKEIGVRQDFLEKKGEEEFEARRARQKEGRQPGAKALTPDENRKLYSFPVYMKRGEYVRFMFPWTDTSTEEGRQRRAFIGAIQSRFNSLIWHMDQGRRLREGRVEQLRGWAKKAGLTVDGILSGQYGGLDEPSCPFKGLVMFYVKDWPGGRDRDGNTRPPISGLVFLDMIGGCVFRPVLPDKSPFYGLFRNVIGFIDPDYPEKAFTWSEDLDDVRTYGDGEQVRNRWLAAKFIRFLFGMSDEGEKGVRNVGEAPEVSASAPADQPRQSKRSRRGSDGDGEGRSSSRRPESRDGITDSDLEDSEEDLGADSGLEGSSGSYRDPNAGGTLGEYLEATGQLPEGASDEFALPEADEAADEGETA